MAGVSVGTQVGVSVAGGSGVAGGGVGVNVAISATSRIGVTVGSDSDGTESTPFLPLHPAITVIANNSHQTNFLL